MPSHWTANWLFCRAGLAVKNEECSKTWENKKTSVWVRVMRNSNISWLRGSFVWREVLFKSGHYLTYLTGKWAREPLFSPFALSGANLHSISFRPEVRQLSNWPPATEAFQPFFHYFTKIHERFSCSCFLAEVLQDRNLAPSFSAYVFWYRQAWSKWVCKCKRH